MEKVKTSGIGTRGGGRAVNDDEIKMKRVRMRRK